MQLSLCGRRALVTGASRGIGLAIAERLGAAGAELVVVARDQVRLERLRIALSEQGITVAATAGDLADTRFRTRVVAECGVIDILVNNAGAIPSGGLELVDEPTWRRAWDLKVFGYIGLCRDLYPRMRGQGGGVMINIIGDSSERPKAHYVCGSVANAALAAFTRAVGETSLRDGIRIVGINPGLIQTDRMIEVLKGRARDLLGDESRWRDMLAGQVVGEPEQVAELVHFLASDGARHINGTCVTIDGGINGAEIIRS